MAWCMNEHRDIAQSLLRKATDDLYAAERLAEKPPASLWIIGFHVQQSVEKAIKGVLVYHSIHYPFTHDIATLIGLVARSELPLPPEAQHLRNLTPFGTQFRYEDEELELPTSMDSERLLKWGSATIAWANNSIGCPQQ